MPGAGAAPGADRGIGHEHAVERDVVRAGAAHAERVPGLDDRDAFRVHRYAELQHGGAAGRVFLDGAGHEQVRGRGAAREHLAAVDAISALDLDGLARAVQPVGPARGQQLDALGRDALEQALGRRLLVDDLHSDNNKLSMDNSLTERGTVVSGTGMTPNWHDVLTGSTPEGRAFPA